MEANFLSCKIIIRIVKKKVNCTLVQALRLCTSRTAHRGSRGIALPFHDHGTRRGWKVSSTTRPHFTPGKDRVPTVQEAGWAPGTVWNYTNRPLAKYVVCSISDVHLKYKTSRNWFYSCLECLLSFYWKTVGMQCAERCVIGGGLLMCVVITAGVAQAVTQLTGSQCSDPYGANF
jgi:hypothetical protein